MSGVAEVLHEYFTLRGSGDARGGGGRLSEAEVTRLAQKLQVAPAHQHLIRKVHRLVCLESAASSAEAQLQRSAQRVGGAARPGSHRKHAAPRLGTPLDHSARDTKVRAPPARGARALARSGRWRGCMHFQRWVRPATAHPRGRTGLVEGWIPTPFGRPVRCAPQAARAVAARQRREHEEARRLAKLEEKQARLEQRDAVPGPPLSCRPPQRGALPRPDAGGRRRGAPAAEPLCVCRLVPHPGAGVAGTPGQDGGGSGCARTGRGGTL
jgi:hypothetical protein